MPSYCIFKCLKGNQYYASSEFGLTPPSSSWLVRTKTPAQHLEKLWFVLLPYGTDVSVAKAASI